VAEHARSRLNVLDLLLEGVNDDPEVNEQRRQERDQDKKDDHDGSQEGQPVAAETMPGILPQADLLLRDLPVDRLLERGGCQGHG